MWSLCPVPGFSMTFTATLPIMASPYVVPEFTLVGVVSWKSIQVMVVPMLTELVCSIRVLADPPVVAYSAAMAFPDDAPLMYA